jgi:hypothetical protein
MSSFMKLNVIKAGHATSKVLESQGVISVKPVVINHRQSPSFATK